MVKDTKSKDKIKRLSGKRQSSGVRNRIFPMSALLSLRYIVRVDIYSNI